MKRLITLIISFLVLSCSSSKKGMQKTATPEQTEISTIQVLKEAIRKNPYNDQTNFRLGLAYAEIDSVDSALVYFDYALDYNPSFAQALFEKGNLLVKKNQLNEGYYQYISALKCENGDEFAFDIASRIGQPYQIHQLTRGNYNNAYGYYSPTGDKIVFQSDRDGNWEIYLMDDQGTQDLRLTNNPAQEEMPVFSIDGKGIAFTSTRDDFSHKDRVDMTRNIYYMEIEGTPEARIVESVNDDWYPSFTNKENEIIFTSEMDDPRDVKFESKLSDIYLKDLKAGSTIRLTQNEVDDGAPSVSRNGKWIVFNSNKSGRHQIYRMDKKGHLVEQLTYLDGNCGAPHFSHECKKITFFAEIDGNYDIYMMTESGGKLTRLTCDPSQDAYPCFSPDGKRIIFHSNRTGKFQIYWIDLTNPLTSEDVIKKIEEKIAYLE